jgi:hypothetical protein
VAQRQERLVEEIRAKRADLRRSAGRLVDFREIELHIRREPLPCQTRSLAGRWANAKVRGAVAETIVTVVSDAVGSAAAGAASAGVPEHQRPDSVSPGDESAAVTD